MVNKEAVAHELGRITGAKFGLHHDGSLTAGNAEPTQASTIQYDLLGDACRKTGLHLLQKVALTPEGRGVPFYDIDEHKTPPDVVARLANIADREPARIARLEEAAELLQAKTGVSFFFDEGHKALLTQDPITVDRPGRHRHMDAIVELSRSGAIQYQFTSGDKTAQGGHKSMVAVFDADVENLRGAADFRETTNPRTDVGGFNVPDKGSRVGFTPTSRVKSGGDD